jgi:hypothetical protein
MDSMDSMDNMDTTEFEQPNPANAPGATGTPDPGTPSRAKWSGRTKRVVTTVAASAVLLGSGAAIGVALTGGASASTGGASAGTASTGSTATTAASAAAGQCAKLAQRLRSHGHPVVANRLSTFCRNPLARLVLVGGAHGTVTFQTKTGPKTIAVERGTIQSASSSAITVLAKDGTTWTWDLTTSTAVREAGSVVTLDKLSTGEQVLVAGQAVSGVNDARLIRIQKAG